MLVPLPFFWGSKLFSFSFCLVMNTLCCFILTNYYQQLEPISITKGVLKLENQPTLKAYIIHGGGGIKLGRVG